MNGCQKNIVLVNIFSKKYTRFYYKIRHEAKTAYSQNTIQYNH